MNFKNSNPPCSEQSEQKMPRQRNGAKEKYAKMDIARLNSASNVFSRVQPMYAEHGIVTFPIRENKRPAISNYQRLGARGSRGLTHSRLANLPAAGFMTNARNRVTVLDVDTTD